MITADNVAGLELTPRAEKSGEWYGSTDYFRTHWGLPG